MFRLCRLVALAGALCLLAVPVGSAAPAFDPANLDRTCPACRDFREFAMGGWIAAHPRPPDRGRYGVFDVIWDHNLGIAREILEADAANPGLTGDQKKIGDLYAACMDEPAIERAGLAPVMPLLAQVDAIDDAASLQQALTRLHELGIGALWDASSEVDVKDAARQIAVIVPAGLSLPDRDFYTRGDEASMRLRDAYAEHVAAMFELTGETPEAAANDARSDLAVETAMAKAQLTNVERRDPDNVYHLRPRSDLAQDVAQIDWPRYFRDRGFPEFSEIDISQPRYLKALGAQLAATPLRDLKAYLRWRVIASYAAWLPKRFADEDFAFRSKLTGAQTQLPRRRRCVLLVDRKLGAALGRAWVARAFPPEAKARAEEMVANVAAALRNDLETLPWMSEATRRRALDKLGAMKRKIGYPAKWRSYAPVGIDRTSLVADIQNADAYDVAFEVAKVGRPVDPTDFEMTPQTVNAYYAPDRNEIVFPAGILQPPVFDYGPDADDAINYGGIGAVIGHEMTHGFDDQGRRFDAHGNVRDWWAPADAAKFESRARCIIDQFSAFPAGDLHVNGRLVQGEAIADLGGLTLAYRAFERAQAGKARTIVDGFTPEQRFFLGFAQIWASSTSSQLERTEVLTDPHPPDRYRVDGTLQNMPAFAAAFGCAATDAMVRAASQRCQIW
jgi:putative endopeptidase